MHLHLYVEQLNETLVSQYGSDWGYKAVIAVLSLLLGTGYVKGLLWGMAKRATSPFRIIPSPRCVKVLKGLEKDYTVHDSVLVKTQHFSVQQTPTTTRKPNTPAPPPIQVMLLPEQVEVTSKFDADDIDLIERRYQKIIAEDVKKITDAKNLWLENRLEGKTTDNQDSNSVDRTSLPHANMSVEH